MLERGPYPIFTRGINMMFTNKYEVPKNRRKTIKTMLALATHLRQLGAGQILPSYPEHGVCSEIIAYLYAKPNAVIPPSKYQSAVYIDHLITNQLLPAWPQGNHSKLFPVPHPTLNRYQAYTTCPKWLADEYGDRRRDLCLWLSYKLEDEAHRIKALPRWYNKIMAAETCGALAIKALAGGLLGGSIAMAIAIYVEFGV
jgi:hypothetical protein